MSKIKIVEPIVFSLAKYLESRGYQIANSIGRRVSKPDHLFIGILKPQPDKRGWFGRRIRQQGIHLGTIWISKYELTFWVYGRKNLDEVKNLVEGVVDEFDVNVRVYLMEE